MGHWWAASLLKVFLNPRINGFHPYLYLIRLLIPHSTSQNVNIYPFAQVSSKNGNISSCDKLLWRMQDGEYANSCKKPKHYCDASLRNLCSLFIKPSHYEALTEGTGMQGNFNDHSRFGLISSCNRRNYLWRKTFINQIPAEKKVVISGLFSNISHHRASLLTVFWHY